MKFSVPTFFALAITSVLAAPVNTISERSFLSGLAGLGQGLKNATAGGIAGTIAQSLKNPSLTADRLKVVTSLASSKKAMTNIANAAANNQQVQSFAAQGSQGLDSASSAVSRIGQALITGTAASTGDQKDVAVGIKAALDATACMNAGGDSQLQSAITASAKPLSDLENAGLGVISNQGESLATLGLPSDFATAAPNCTLSS